MISLQLPSEPFEINILPGISFTVRPLTTFDMSVAQAAARQAIERMEQSIDDAVFAGLTPRDIDLKDPAARDGLFQQLLIGELGERHITAWTGIQGDDGEPVAADTPGARRAVAAQFPIGGIFHARLTQRHWEMLAAKKDCGTDASGTSSPAAVPDTAADAPMQATSAP